MAILTIFIQTVYMGLIINFCMADLSLSTVLCVKGRMGDMTAMIIGLN